MSFQICVILFRRLGSRNDLPFVSNRHFSRSGLRCRQFEWLKKWTSLQSIEWRCRSKHNLIINDEAFLDSTLFTPPGPTPLWGPGPIPDNWADFCGFLKPGFHRFWEVHGHDAFSFPRNTLETRQTGQRCHHEKWLHLDLVDWSNTWSKQGAYEPRVSLKTRPAECLYGNPKKTHERNHERALVIPSVTSHTVLLLHAGLFSFDSHHNCTV